MIFATAFVVHRAYSAGRSAAWSRNFGIALVGGFVVFSAYHCWTDELLVHFLLFGGMTLAVWWKTRRLVRERRIRAKTESGDGDAKLAKLKSLVRVGARKFVTCWCWV